MTTQLSTTLNEPDDRNNRSAITNGTRFFIDSQRVHSSSERARRFRDHHALLAAELGVEPNDSQDALLRRAAGFALLCELMETSLIAGDAIDQRQHIQNTRELRACLTQLGITRPTRDLTKAESKGVDEHAAAMMEE